MNLICLSKHTLGLFSIKQIGNHSCFPSKFTKGHNFRNLLFVSLNNVALPKLGQLSKTRISS